MFCVSLNDLLNKQLNFQQFEPPRCPCDDTVTKDITKTYDKHFPEKCKKIDKYKHKRSKWIPPGILKSIKFRDKLCKSLKICSSGNGDYDLLKYNLKVYNGYLNRCIRTAKKEFYHNKFNRIFDRQNQDP